MTHRMRVCLAATAAPILILAAAPSRAEVSGATRLGNVGSTLFAAVAPGQPNLLYLAGRTGTIRTFDLTTNTLSSTPFLSIPGVSDLGSEGGLLGLAFAPDYQTSGKFYASYTVNGGQFNAGLSRLAEYTRSASNPNAADPSSARTILEFSQPQGNHNAGWIGFSPTDGYLYMASGDGGGSDDNDANHTAGTGNSQDITNNLLGKILRIDPNGDDFPPDNTRNYRIPAGNPFVGVTGDDEIWAYGLRNPYRDSFDRVTGDLWIGDVGQNTREEVNFQPAGLAGVNYGWRLREGTIATPSGGVGGAKPPGAVDPLYEYSHGSGALQGNSIIGGYVYRGPDPTIQGDYFFADYVNSAFWRFDPANPTGTVQRLNTTLFGSGPVAVNPVSFSEDANGNLYIITQGGDLFRINTNALVDGDFNADGRVDQADYAAWASQYGGVGSADANGDGVVDAADYTVWRDNLGRTAQGLPLPSSAPEPTALGVALTALPAMRVRRHRKAA